MNFFGHIWTLILVWWHFLVFKNYMYTSPKNLSLGFLGAHEFKATRMGFKKFQGIFYFQT